MGPFPRRLPAIAATCLAALFCAKSPAQQNDPQSQSPEGPAIQVTVNSVLVPVVVRDSQGRAVGDLTRDDFQVFDNGKRQLLSGFTIQQRAIQKSAANTLAPSPSPSEVSPAAPPQPPSTPQRFIVFLFDDLHLSEADLLRVKTVATRMLAESLADSDMAAVVSLSGANSGLTRDRATLQQAVRNLKIQQLFRHDEHACPNIGFYQADLIQNKRSEPALKSAEADYVTCAALVGVSPNMVESMVRSAASQSLLNGEQDAYASLRALTEYVNKMSALPGQRLLILISPGFFTMTPEAIAEKSLLVDAAARANVTISSLDARGLYSTEMDASQRGGSSAQDLATGLHAQYHADEMNFNEDVMSELAMGTGGTFFHNNNDLQGGLQRLTEQPEFVYLLAFSPQKVKPDGAFHTLKVKLNRRGLTLQARRGYLAPKSTGSSVLSASSAPPSPQTPPPSAIAAPATTSPSAAAVSPPPPSPPAAIAPRPREPAKEAKRNSMLWDPPNVDAPLRARTSAPCPLSDVLQRAGERAESLVANLQDFTAQEKIAYQLLSNSFAPVRSGGGTFDYTVVVGQRRQEFSVQESRTPQRGSRILPVSAQDVGLPEMALIFLPGFQSDYEMKCEGSSEWNGQPAWVVAFQQRKDRPSHTAMFSVKGVVYPAKLKGRAWIAQAPSAQAPVAPQPAPDPSASSATDLGPNSGPRSGQVIHLETSLMEAVTNANVRQMYLSIDYAPVQFRTQNVRIWLPQSVDAYGDFGDHRAIIFHTFSDFLLFSVQTDETVAKPGNP